MKRTILQLVTALSMLATVANAQTKVPATINYQGNVRNAAGTAIGAGTAVTRLVTFRFWNNPTAVQAGNRLWSESAQVTILDGNFSVLIGTGSPVSGETNSITPFANIFSQSSAVYLGITVDDGNSSTTDGEISPRQQLVSTAFAFRSTVAESVDASAISSAMLASGAVTATQLGSAAVTTAKIATDAVTSSQIANGTITSADIATDTIVAADIAPNAVASSEILDGSIIGADIASGTIPLASLVAAVQQALVPAGTVVAYGGTTAPAGWLVCDGANYLRTDYPTLFVAIGTNFGTATVTGFNVPDLRGTFIRGWSNLGTLDPDKLTRTAVTTGGASGNSIGSIQAHAMETHTHTYTSGTTNTRLGGTSGSYTNREGSNIGTSSGAGASTENRPVNTYMNYIIKL